MKNKSNKKLLAFIIILIIAAYLFTFGFIAIFICMGLGIFPTPKSVRRMMKQTYSDDNTYSTIVGQAQIRYYNEKEMYITLTLDEVLVDNYDHYIIGNDYYYYYLPTQCETINANGFKELLSEPITDKYGATYYEVTRQVTMIVSEDIWWDGMSPFAVGLSVDDNEYLPYETGKANLLHYIEYEMH